jgi:hypothetical protein
MAAKKKLVVTLDILSAKKSVIRFDGSDDEDILKTIYVGRDAVESLGDPGAIKVTIEAA